MNKKDRQREAILRHGFDLIRAFNLRDYYNVMELGPVSVCKKVHRLEIEAHRYAEQLCNGDIDPTEEQQEKKKQSILKRLDALLHFTAQDIPIFINMDPRGYALKIENWYVREEKLDIHRDLGGYGIIAPEF